MGAPEMHSWDFTRLDEIVDYANRRGISVKVAIIELVNAALSHGLDQICEECQRPKPLQCRHL